MGRYCDYEDEYVEESRCDDCSENGCKNHPENREKENDELDSLRKSELATKMRERLAGLLNLDTAVMDKLIEDLFTKVLSITKVQMKASLEPLAKAKAMEYVDTKAKDTLDKCFKEAMDADIARVLGEEEDMVTTIRLSISKSFKDFFAEKDSYRGREYIKDSLEKVIEKDVSLKVDEAIKEMKAEAIEKFNKAAMKLMMSGMARAISADKTLLTLLTAGEQ